MLQVTTNAAEQRSTGVTISIKDYNHLITCANKLAALEAGGVDNWDGYGDCFDNEEKEDE